MVAAAGRNNFEFWKHKLKAQKGKQPLNNGRLNKTPKTPKTTKTATGGARIGRIRPRRFLCVLIQLFIQKEKSERISHLEDTVRLSLFVKEQYS